MRGVVLDIEGTTTPIAFVHDTLFSYARKHLREHLTASSADATVREAVELLEHERAADGVAGDLAEYAEWLMVRDRKSPGLKLLQGKIWERGYGDGTLRGEVFADVPPALVRWRAGGVELAIYSSGSVLAQRLLFGSTAAGDLTGLFAHFFDTGVGPKQSRESYQRIARAITLAPDRLLFISDVPDELDAARTAGFQPLLCIRPGNGVQRASDTEVIRSFDEVGA